MNAQAGRSRGRVARFRTWLGIKHARTFQAFSGIVAGTATIAFVSLIIEDLFPSPTGPNPKTTGLRLFLGFVFGVLVFLVWIWGQHTLRRRGTLYYIRLLAANYVDWHVKDIIRETRNDLRTATRWFDPGSRVDSRWVDVSRETRAVSDEVERMFNDDLMESGFQVFPNLFLPAGLSIGYDWVPPEEAELVEYDRGTIQFRFFVHNCCLKLQEIQYPNPGDGLLGARTVELTEGVLAGEWERVERVWLTMKLTGAIESGMFAKDVDKESSLRSGCDVLRVVGAFESCDKAESAKAEGSDLNPTSLGTSSSGSETLLAVNVPENRRSAERWARGTFGKKEYQGLQWPTADRFCAKKEIRVVDAEPWHLVNLATYWIRQSLVDFPAATIFLSMQVPKTVSIAVGWRINQAINRTELSEAIKNQEWANPWQRIVPIGMVSRRNKSSGIGAEIHTIARVRPDQPNPERLFEGGALKEYVDECRADMDGSCSST